MRECPECRADLPQYAMRCRCGWKSANVSELPTKERILFACDYCLTDYQYHRKHELHNNQNRIVGRSVRGGYICRDCYERRPVEEYDAIDARVERLYDEHRDLSDKIGIMLRAACGKHSKADRHEQIQWMKEVVRNFGKLPYDKSKREEVA